VRSTSAMALSSARWAVDLAAERVERRLDLDLELRRCGEARRRSGEGEGVVEHVELAGRRAARTGPPSPGPPRSLRRHPGRPAARAVPARFVPDDRPPRDAWVVSHQASPARCRAGEFGFERRATRRSASDTSAKSTSARETLRAYADQQLVRDRVGSASAAAAATSGGTETSPYRRGCGGGSGPRSSSRSRRAPRDATRAAGTCAPGGRRGGVRRPRAPPRRWAASPNHASPGSRRPERPGGVHVSEPPGGRRPDPVSWRCCPSSTSVVEKPTSWPSRARSEVRTMSPSPASKRSGAR
jgi:hypothetical protein